MAKVASNEMFTLRGLLETATQEVKMATAHERVQRDINALRASIRVGWDDLIKVRVSSEECRGVQSQILAATNDLQTLL